MNPAMQYLVKSFTFVKICLDNCKMVLYYQFKPPQKSFNGRGTMKGKYKKYRKFHGLSLRAAAKLCGVSHTTLGDFEKGKIEIANRKIRGRVERYYKNLERRAKIEMVRAE